MVLPTGEVRVNQLLVAAARTAGLTYLRHIVAAHDLSNQTGQLTPDGLHLRVHTDVLIFSRSLLAGSDG